MLDYTFNPLAEQEYVAAVEEYAAGGHDAHLRFVTTFEAAILQIRNFLESGPVARNRIRSKVLSGFPYTIYYSVYAAGGSRPRGRTSPTTALLLAWSPVNSNTKVGYAAPDEPFSRQSVSHFAIALGGQVSSPPGASVIEKILAHLSLPVGPQSPALQRTPEWLPGVRSGIDAGAGGE